MTALERIDDGRLLRIFIGESVIEELDGFIDEGLMTLERVEVHLYRGRSS